MRFLTYKFWQKAEPKPAVQQEVEEFKFADTVYMRHTVDNESYGARECVQGSTDINQFRQYAMQTKPIEVAVYALVEVRRLEFPPVITHTDIHRVIPEPLPYPVALTGSSEKITKQLTGKKA